MTGRLMVLAKSESYKPIRAFFIDDATDVSTHVPSLDQIEASHVRLVIHQAVPHLPVRSAALRLDG